MPQTLRISIAQLNPVLGDLEGNAAKVRAAFAEAAQAGSVLLALPEMFITGYPPRDLIRKPAFLDAAQAVIRALARDCADGPAIGIGGPLAEGDAVYNAWYVLQGGEIATVVRKHRLNPHGAFDELRLFDPGPDPASGLFRIGKLPIGVAICEDARYWEVPAALEQAGARVLIVPNGSPYHRGKQALRIAAMRERVDETGLPLISLNLTGGQDDLVFDGAGFAINPDGSIAMQTAPFAEGLTHLDLEAGCYGCRIRAGIRAALPDDLEQDYHAICMGLGDYLRKSGFSKVVLGLSGGLDSALVAAIAADVVGPDNLHCLLMPSEYTSAASIRDARAVAEAIGCRLDRIGIDGARAAMDEALAPLMAGTQPDTTEENIQARLRAVMLMAISNKFGGVLLTTSNKSEVAVGYSTIYGDTCGGYNPIKDLYKSRVFQISRWRNANWRPWMAGPKGEVIAPRIIDKPPSAELRPDQQDADSLPPYAVLDQILESLIEHDMSLAELVAEGFDPQILHRIERLIAAAEWKREQEAPGPRLTTRAFGTDRRYPITNRWRDPG